MADQTWFPQLDINADIKHSGASSMHYEGFKPKMCYQWDGKDLQCEFVLNEMYQGWPGVAHGGTLMSLLDEGMGYENYFQGLKCVTAQMQTKFKKPTPVGKVLRLRASIVQKNRRLVEVTASISTEDNSVTTESAASFFVFNSANVIGKRLTRAVIWAVEGVILNTGEGMRPRPEALDLIKQAAEYGIKNIVISALPLESLKKVLRDLGIDGYVSTVDRQNLIRDQITTENLSSVIKANGLACDECVAIQSTPVGIAAANNLRVRCIAVTGACPEQNLGNSDLIVDSLMNLTPLNLEHLSIVYIPSPPLSVRKWVADE